MKEEFQMGNFATQNFSLLHISDFTKRNTKHPKNIRMLFSKKNLQNNNEFLIVVCKN
jgi:hypothetical protein